MSLSAKNKGYSHRKKILIIALSVLVAFGIWILYVLNGLRIFVPYYPFLSGFPLQSKNYLVVFQNDAELRPGGGFITAYGVLRFVSGLPVGLEINDVFSLTEDDPEIIEPPYPMGELLKGPFYTGWAFQDSNWFADFGENAQKMIWFYNRKFPQDRIDGVIAFNFSVLEDLLAILGEIRVNDLTFNRANLFSLLEHSVSNIDRHNVEDLKRRKDILKHLYGKILTAALLSPIKYELISNMLEQKLRSKEIQLYFSDTILANLAARKHWDGRIAAAGKSDFLAVVEANLAGMKSDRYMRREIDYYVDISGTEDPANQRRAKAKLSVRLTHLGDYNEPLSYTYKGYMRVLIPKESLVLKQPDLIETEESGYKAVGRIIEVNPGEEKTFTWEYILPSDTVLNDHYELHVHKQPGTDDIYHIAVHTPPDFVLTGGNWQLQDNLASFTGTLTNDTDLALDIQADHIPPRITFQIFKDLQTIELHFNEAVNRSECEKPENYSIRDKNVNHPETTDQPIITKIACGEKGALLTLTGVSKQPEEHYSLSVRNVQDVYHNVITPDPKTITVVQRIP